VNYKHVPITEDTKIEVIYEYDNDDPLGKVYGDQNLIVISEGVKKALSPADQEEVKQ